MKLGISAQTRAFTISEMMIAIAIASLILGVTVTASIALQRSFNSVDDYLSTHMQQIRIVDFLARDVKRGLSVSSSIDKQKVDIKIPKYIIQAGDSDATGSNIGTPRPPTRAVASREFNINYGTTTNSVRYEVSGASILRKELKADGTWSVTTIASSTDNLIPETLDTELANTEYATTAITFKPRSVADKSGTIVYSTAYLRNRRRIIP